MSPQALDHKFKISLDPSNAFPSADQKPASLLITCDYKGDEQVYDINKSPTSQLPPLPPGSGWVVKNCCPNMCKVTLITLVAFFLMLVFTQMAAWVDLWPDASDTQDDSSVLIEFFSPKGDNMDNSYAGQ